MIFFARREFNDLTSANITAPALRDIAAVIETTYVSFVCKLNLLFKRVLQTAYDELQHHVFVDAIRHGVYAHVNIYVYGQHLSN